MDKHTIAAIATPPGRGGVGIVRVSGSKAPQILQALIGQIPEPRRAVFSPFTTPAGDILDTGIALFFAGPHSFTGEDIAELHCHGGPVVLDRVLKATLGLGARLAQPGEFSQRAFLNDKIDLTEAEAIADLIDSASEDAARLAVRTLQGEFSARIHTTVQALVQLRTGIEAHIDFPDEEVDPRVIAQLQTQLRSVIERLTSTFDAARQGAILREGLVVVIAGAPNAGKSTLLNQLAGNDVAIVTEIPGTTRDILRAEIQIDGMPVHIIDTAGLRESSDPVEQEGIRRARAEIERADLVLLLIDDSHHDDAQLQILRRSLGPTRRVTRVFNKVDLTGRQAGIVDVDGERELGICANDGRGIDSLREHLKSIAGFRSSGETTFLARTRHVDAMTRALESMRRAAENLSGSCALELIAEDLRIAQQHLGQITGEFTSDDLLGEIFSTFCIGK